MKAEPNFIAPHRQRPVQIDPAAGGTLLRAQGLSAEWGDPNTCRAWIDEYGRERLIIGGWHDGRRAEFVARPGGVTLTLARAGRIAG